MTTQAKDDPVEYIHDEIGYNYRLTNIQAAMGCAQIEQLDDYIAAKRRIAATYSRAWEAMPGITPMSEAPWAHSIFWMYTVLVDEAEYAMSSRELIGHLSGHGIQARPLWMPIHRQRPYQDCQAYRIEVTDQLHDQAVNLPSSVGLAEEEQDRVVRVVRSAER